MLALIARYRAKPGQGDQVEALLLEMIAAVRGNEPGCVLYRPTRSPSDPDAFLLYEEYLDQQALDAHRRTAVPLGGLRALSIHLS